MKDRDSLGIRGLDSHQKTLRYCLSWRFFCSDFDANNETDGDVQGKKRYIDMLHSREIADHP